MLSLNSGVTYARFNVKPINEVVVLNEIGPAGIRSSSSISHLKLKYWVDFDLTTSLVIAKTSQDMGSCYQQLL